MHVLDIIALVAYFLGIIFIGYKASLAVKNTTDLFIGGRRFGKIVSMFMAFGAGTSDAAPVGTSREAFRNGFSGIWVALAALFTMPFYWIYSLWFRRLRLLTIADLFHERFSSKYLGAVFGLFTIIQFTFFGASHLVAIGKTAEAMFPKSSESYTAAEKKNVALYQEYDLLQGKVKAGEKESIDYARYTQL
jgi:SSS family solute:Na+ symporter